MKQLIARDYTRWNRIQFAGHKMKYLVPLFKILIFFKTSNDSSFIFWLWKFQKDFNKLMNFPIIYYP